MCAAGRVQRPGLWLGRVVPSPLRTTVLTLHSSGESRCSITTGWFLPSSGLVSFLFPAYCTTTPHVSYRRNFSPSPSLVNKALHCVVQLLLLDWLERFQKVMAILNLWNSTAVKSTTTK
ncbi:hypothetical protein BDA96_02G107400 [Sorghum bicolor]|uniref:Uncharacterized protein n=2 Tax=Sorghum bicolor TaxID=4558 RepID=A0A921RMQ1_SORBI|nr:hypothetical protein BDA96_02G107400 [Sorghum bicolor]KXG34875.1 hypothetical protein SORBI_3002G102500 [Sorghum bicolor]